MGLDVWGWVALAALVAGLAIAAILLAPWEFKFAVGAEQLYDELFEQATAEAEGDTLGRLASAGYGYQALRFRLDPVSDLVITACAVQRGLLR